MITFSFLESWPPIKLIETGILIGGKNLIFSKSVFAVIRHSEDTTDGRQMLLLYVANMWKGERLCFFGNCIHRGAKQTTKPSTRGIIKDRRWQRVVSGCVSTRCNKSLNRQSRMRPALALFVSCVRFLRPPVKNLGSSQSLRRRKSNDEGVGYLLAYRNATIVTKRKKRRHAMLVFFLSGRHHHRRYLPNNFTAATTTCSSIPSTYLYIYIYCVYIWREREIDGR